MKKPTIHITVNALAEILEELGISNSYAMSSRVLDIAHSRGMQLRNRAMIVGKSGTKKRVERVVKTDNAALADSFQSILILKRRQAKHKHISTIGKTDRDYTLLKTVAELAEEFCTVFKHTDKQIGYGKFCEIGIALMGKKYGLNKFKYYSEKIFEVEEGLRLIRDDENEAGTSTLYAHWQKALLEYAGLERHIGNTSMDYVHFVYARQEADLYKADYRDWVYAQFEGLAFMNVVPELSQLYSGQASSRYESYRANKKIGGKTKKKDDEEDNDFDDEMDDYFKKLEGK